MYHLQNRLEFIYILTYLSRSGLPVFRRRFGRATYTTDIVQSEEYFTNWMRYYHREGRRIIYFTVASISYMHPLYRCKNLGKDTETTQAIGADDNVEACLFSSQNDDGGSSPTYETQEIDATGEGASQNDDNGGIKISQDGKKLSVKRIKVAASPTIKRKKKMIEHDELVTAIRHYLVVPFYSTCQIPAWYRDKSLAFYDQGDNDYKRAVNHVSMETAHLTYDEIRTLTASVPKPYYYERADPNHYMDIQRSFDIIHQLLLLQYETEEKLGEFVQRIYNLMEMKLPKKNTMFIEGPANSGKSLFANCLCAYYLNVGHICNMVRGQNFPLNDCVNRRVLYWNEPNMCSSFYDTLKMVFGGDPCPANIKYQGHSTILRTPCLLTGNRLTIPQDAPFKARVFYEKWKAAPFLKDIPNYPYPRCIEMIYDKYIFNKEG